MEDDVDIDLDAGITAIESFNEWSEFCTQPAEMRNEEVLEETAKDENPVDTSRNKSSDREVVDYLPVNIWATLVSHALPHADPLHDDQPAEDCSSLVSHRQPLPVLAGPRATASRHTAPHFITSLASHLLPHRHPHLEPEPGAGLVLPSLLAHSQPCLNTSQDSLDLPSKETGRRLSSVRQRLDITEYIFTLLPFVRFIT